MAENKLKSILVTGARGFIGKPLVLALRAFGYIVHEHNSSDGDIADPATLKQFDEVDFDFAFHLAGRTYVPDAWHDPADFQRVNVNGTLNVLELCRRKNVPLTFISAYIYGIPESLPIKEGDKAEPNNPYALSKHLAETLCKFYAEFFSLPVTILRPFNIFGPGQKAHFLIPEIITHVQNKTPIRLKDLAPRRDYLYIADLVDALMCTLQMKNGYHLFNIGYGSSLSVAEIVDVIQSVAGTSLPVISENMPRQNEIPDVYADISKAETSLSWKPIHSFQQGIKAMLLSTDCRIKGYRDE